MPKQSTTKNVSTKKMAKQAPSEKKQRSRRHMNQHILHYLSIATVQSLSNQKPELAARLDRWVEISFCRSPRVNVDNLRRGEPSMWVYSASILVSIAESAGTTPPPPPQTNEKWNDADWNSGAGCGCR
jgi:hypothetical protein